MAKQFGSATRLDLSARSSPALLRRRSRASMCRSSARDAIADLAAGSHIFGLTAGQFSMIDLAAAALEITGPAEVGLWTWCIAEYEVEAMGAFLRNGRITGLRVVMDYSGARRDMPLIGELQAQYGVDCIRATKTHAKIVTLRNEGWRVVIRGSMNLNENPRFEQFDISEGPEVYDVVAGVMRELWERTPAVPVRQMTSQSATASFGLIGAGAKPSWAAPAPGKRNWW